MNARTGPVDMTGEPENPIAQLFADARFGFGEVKELTESSTENDWDEIIGKVASIDGGLLQKACDGMRRTGRRIALEQFIRKSLALGEAVASLVEYAQRRDPDTATMLREIGAKIGAA